MTPEERQLLTSLFDRVRDASGNARDAEAESFIADQVRAQPAAPYLLAQTVLVQEQALRAANEHIQKLEADLRQAQQQEQQPAAQGGSFLGGLGKSLFGGGPAAPSPGPAAPHGPWGQTSMPASPPPSAWGAPPPPPQPQGYGAPSAGGSFLHGALGTAAGVAGGVLLANSIRGLFSNNNAFGIGSGFGGGMPTGGFGLGGGGLGGGGGETVINNYYDQPGGNDASGVTNAGYDDNSQDYGSDDDNTPDDSSFGQDDGGDFGGGGDDGSYDV